MSCNGCSDDSSKFTTAVEAIAHGALGVAKAILGVDAAPPAVVIERRNICRECEFAAPCKKNSIKKCYCGPLWDGLMHKAGTCGCLISLKTVIASETCPKAKWGKYRPTAPCLIPIPPKETPSPAVLPPSDG